jgi:hypothetical protein
MKAKIIIVSVVLCLCAAAIPLFAADKPKDKPGIIGDWKISADFDGNQMLNRMSVSQKPDGTLLIKWGLGSTGGKISDVNLAGNKLTFVRTSKGFGGDDMESDIEATLQPKGSLTGKMSSDFGEFDFTGTRILPKSDIVGVWAIKCTDANGQPAETKLTIKQDPNGPLKGKWKAPAGDATVSDVQFKDGKLTLKLASKTAGKESQSTYEAQLKGDQLTGKIQTGSVSKEANGSRFGKNLIGEWELTVVSERGDMPAALLVEKDLSAVYNAFFGENNVENLKLDGDKLTFSVSFGFGDRTFEMDFSGTVTGDNIKGQMTSERGTSDVSGKKITATPAADASKK